MFGMKFFLLDLKYSLFDLKFFLLDLKFFLLDLKFFLLDLKFFLLDLKFFLLEQRFQCAGIIGRLYEGSYTQYFKSLDIFISKPEEAVLKSYRILTLCFM